MALAATLRTVGLDVEVSVPGDDDRGVDAVLTIRSGSGKPVRFAVEEKSRAPYPNELQRLEHARTRARSFGHPLLLAPFVSEALASRLTDAGWSWSDTQGNFDLRAPGLLLRERRTHQPPKRVSRGLPQGSGALAIIRALIRLGEGEDEGPSVTSLASQAGVSQPRASQVIGQLHNLGLIRKSEIGRWVPAREELLDRFLAEYRGPGGTEQHLYSIDEPIDTATRIAHLTSRRHPIAVSADVGSDLLVPWRRPTMLVVYASSELPLADLNLVESQGKHDANVIVRHPNDRSVFRTPELVAEVRGVGVPLADETQLLWDLEDLGGDDRLEAAGRLREWLLIHR